MVPAVEGTLNVVRAAKDAGGVRRVVVTSSISAVVPNPGWPAGEVVDERCWADIDYCEKNGVSIDYCSCLGSSFLPNPTQRTHLMNSGLWEINSNLCMQSFTFHQQFAGC